MKQLSNFIKIMPLSDFTSFDGTNMSGSSVPDLIQSTNDLQFEELPQYSAPGVIYNQSLSLITTGKLSDAQRKKYSRRRPVVVLVYDENGVASLWGNDDERVRITITPKTDRDILELDRKATTPLF